MTLTDEQATRILKMYRSRKKQPLVLAQLLNDAIAECDSAGDFVRQLARADTKGQGLTNGTVSHYRRLLLLPDELKSHMNDGNLAYRVARELIRLGPERALKVSPPFIGPKPKLRNSRAEKYLALAKRFPNADADELVKRLNGKPLKPTATEWTAPKRTEPARIKPQDVLRAATELLGRLRSCEWDDSPDALMAKAMLKKLEAEMKELVPMHRPTEARV